MSYTNTKTLRFEEAEKNPLVLVDMGTLQAMLDRVIGNALQGLNLRGSEGTIEE